MIEAIEEELDKQINRIRPEILKLAMIRVDRNTNPDVKGWAYINLGMKPPIITIQSRVIEEFIKDNIIEVLRHEYSHLIQGNTIDNEKKVNIFK